MKIKVSLKNGVLTVAAPEGVQWNLYAGTPTDLNYFRDVAAGNPIPATDLEPGLYHIGLYAVGYNALCQVINYTGAPLQLELQLDKLAGNGYEAGYVTLYTPEFMAAQMLSEKDAWGEEYAKLFVTPQFQPGRPGRHQQTTNAEMMAFIEKYAKACPYMHVFSLGKSPKYGYDMPLVLFTRENVADMTLAQAAEVVRSTGKPTIQYTAQCHSTEPASTEGALAMIARLCGDYGRVLDTVDLYIIPRINLDGAVEAIRKSPTTDEDMNRDYLYMHNAEVWMVTGAYNLFLPEVAIDGHEKKYRAISSGNDICTDMEVQTGAGSLNHPAYMTELVMKMALVAMKKAHSLGLRTHFYDKLASAAGGTAGSSYFGTRNSLSFLVETPGQLHMGMFCMERRVLAQYVLASSVIDYTVEHAAQILQTVHTSWETMRQKGAIYDENDVIVLEHERVETGAWATPLLHVPTGEILETDHSIAYREHTAASSTRPRATAYLVPMGLEKEAAILQTATNHAIGYYSLPAGSCVRVRQYVQTEDKMALTEEQEVCFENGVYVFPNTLPSTILSVIMEPDFNRASGRKMTLLSMGHISADGKGFLPVFRYCHDLTEGKVSVK